ncbi:YbaB/EbfC family nucleoid-associated protein [Alphaproteobacteria bacterium]|nr:YbaB/EbfC family nucleoid-associated protein [Alphaproteobacteria bacterium]
MKNLGQMMKQAQQMQGRIEEMQNELSKVEISGESGGGLVKVILNGKGLMVGSKIDKSVVNDQDILVLEDLIVAAHNDAKRKVEEYAAEEMKKITGGINLPPGMQLPF